MEKKRAKTPGRSGSWAAKKTIVGWFSRHGIVVTERSAYNEGWRWKVSLEWDGKPPACVRFNMCFGDALHLRDLKGYGNTLDEAWDNFARNVSSCESVVFRKTHVTGYGAVREKESAEKMFSCGACETLGEFALRLAAAGGARLMDVWCAIPTPETECAAEQVYVPTPVRSEDLAGGYVRRGGAFGPDDVLITMQLLACVRHMEPRRNVWGVMRPGDTRRKRVADFGARSFRELLLRMAAEGYAE